MRTICSQCGEELIGAVNRCWKCGTSVSTAVQPAKPPVRRPPVTMPGVQSAAMAADPPSARASILDLNFGPRTHALCARASIWGGAVGCLMGLRTVWCCVPALCGLLLGVVGMRARRRDLAATGLVISVLALFLAFLQVGLDIHARIQSRQLLDGYQEQDF